MLKLEEKEYNLDNIFFLNFDLLKEILIKLSKNDQDISQELNEIKTTNISRDQKIFDLEQKITELNNNIININNIIKEKDNEIKNIIEEKNNEIKNIIEENTEKINIKMNTIPEYKKNIISIEKINDLVISNEDINKIEENHANTEKNIDIKNKPKEINKKIKNFFTDKENDINTRSNKKYRTDINIINNEFLIPKEKSKNNNNNKDHISNLKIRNILHEITEIKDRINYVENNLLTKNAETLKISKELLSDHNIQSMSKFNSIKEEISQIQNKQNQLNQTLSQLAEKLEEKNSSINFANNNKRAGIINIFNDNSEEENTGNKNPMTMSFMENVNKRFELNNERYLKLFEENYKLKQNIDNLNGIIDNINRNFDNFKKDNLSFNDAINKIKEEIKKINNDINIIKNKENNNDIYNQNLKNINDYINNKINELMKYLLDSENNNNKNINEIPINNIKDQTMIKLLNQKMNELNEKINKIEENSKNEKNILNNKLEEINNINKKIEEINDIIKLKLEKKDLDDIYNINNKNKNEINNIKLKLEEISLGIEKIRNDNPNFIKRLESLTNGVSKLKNNIGIKIGDKIINEYHTKIEGEHQEQIINEEKIKNMISPIAEEIEKLIIEVENINLKVKSILAQNKLFIKKKNLDKIENELYDKIISIENNLEIKYLKKTEFNKIIKTIEIQLKQLQGNNNQINNNQKSESENWILAKQPLKCFNCASCEANLNNTLQQNDYLPWSKYHGQYRIGQGFSKLLKKLNDNISENKDINKTEKKNILLNNSFENIIEEKPVTISLKKYKLPKLIGSLRRKQKSTSELIPVSDSEKEEKLEINEASPQILKITKLKYDDIQNQNIFELNKNKTGRNSDKRNNNINRVQSLPLH